MKPKGCVLVMESSMQSQELWGNVVSRLEASIGTQVYYQNIGSTLVTRQALYDKGLSDFEAVDCNVENPQFPLFGPIFSRLDAHKNIDRDLRELYCWRFVSFWSRIIREHSIQLVISPVAPHRVYDFALLLACRFSGAEFLSFQTTPFPKRLLLIRDYIGPVDHIVKSGKKTDGIRDIVESDIARRLKSYDLAIPVYEKINMRRASETHRSVLRLLRKIGRKDYSFWSSLKNAKNIVDGGHITPFRYILYFCQKRIHLHALKRRYDQLSSEVDLADNYVFFPLHYQPEETSCPSGGHFSNQLLVIEKLLLAVPPDVKIFVKEHRSQFNPTMSGNLGRSVEFYEHLSREPRVVLVKTTTDQFSLIDKAKMVVSVTGTACYEAYCRDKKSVFFGRSWLAGCSNVHSYNSTGDLRAFYEQEIAKLTIDEKVAEVSALLSHSIEAIHDENYEKLYGPPGVDDEDALSKAICDYVRSTQILEQCSIGDRSAHH